MKMMSQEARIQASVASRAQLIATLEQKLREAPADVDLARKRRLADRIADLKKRQANPAEFLWQGKTLRQKHTRMSPHLW